MIKFSYCEYLFQFHNTEINVIIFCRDCEEAAEEETVKVMLRQRWSSLWVYDCVCVCVGGSSGTTEVPKEEYKYYV